MVALHKIVGAGVSLLIVGFLVGPEVAQGQTPFQIKFCTAGPNCASDSFQVPNGEVLLVIEFVSAACNSSDPTTIMTSLEVQTRVAGPRSSHRFLPHLVGPARSGSGDRYTVSQNTRLYALDPPDMAEENRTEVRFVARRTGNGTVQCGGSVSGQLH